MDYSKSGGGKPARKAPRHKEHNAKGSTKNPFGTQSDTVQDRAQLLARLKAAAETPKKP
ncbi:MAG: hypothetical protein LBE86_00195 [Gemmobacter sp.]|jgi:hypothetical protein|nr:hypothetical protein [Gemmobacter sp.]